MAKRRKSTSYYENLIDYDDSNKNKILSKEDIEQGAFYKLDDYLERVFIPSSIQYRSVDGTFGEEKSFIYFNKISEFGFSKVEAEYVVEYLRRKGIEVISRFFTFENDGMTKSYYFANQIMTLAYNSPLIEKSRQLELFGKYKKSHDKKILDELFVGNMRIVYSALRIFAVKNKISFLDFSFEEFEAVGLEALSLAIETFDSKLGFAFSSYAYRVILNAYSNHFRNNKNDLIEKFNSARLIIEEKFGVTLKEDFSIFDDILSYMLEEKMISPNDYASTYKSILYTLKKYYTLAVTENFDCSIEEVDEAIDYENLLAKLNDNFLETHGIRDIEWLIYSLGLDGFSKKKLYRTC